MKSKEIIKLFRQLNKPGVNIIDNLYAMDCLKNSDGCIGDRVFENDDELYRFSCIVVDMWLDDENNLSMSLIADWLVEYILEYGKEMTLKTSINDLLSYGYLHFNN